MGRDGELQKKNSKTLVCLDNLLPTNLRNAFPLSPSHTATSLPLLGASWSQGQVVRTPISNTFPAELSSSLHHQDTLMMS